MGVLSAENKEAPFGKLMQYNTLYNTLQVLDLIIKISFKYSIFMTCEASKPYDGEMYLVPFDYRLRQKYRSDNF